MIIQFNGMLRISRKFQETSTCTLYNHVFSFVIISECLKVTAIFGNKTLNITFSPCNF